MHSIFGIGSKRIKTRLCLQKYTFISVLSYLIHFQTGLHIARKKVFKKKMSTLPTYPNFFQGVT